MSPAVGHVLAGCAALTSWLASILSSVAGATKTEQTFQWKTEKHRSLSAAAAHHRGGLSTN